MGLLRVRQLTAALHRGKIHLVCRQLEALMEHGGDQVEVPGGQHRADLFPHQGLQRGEHHVGEGVVQGENASQLPLNGAEHRIFHMEPLGKFHLHQIHKGGGAHQHLVAADGGRQAASLIAAQVLSVPKNGSLGTEQIVEQLGQAAARIPDQGGGVPHHLLDGPVAEYLDAVEFHITRWEQVPVSEEDPVPLLGLGCPRPAGQSRAAGGQPPGQLVEGAAIHQSTAEGGGGGKGGGEAPQQVLGLAKPIGGQQGEQQAGQQQQGADHPVDALGPVIHLDLTAEAVGNAGPLAVGVPAVPFSLIQGENIGLCR